MCGTRNRGKENKEPEECGCGSGGRRYFTKEEQLERLEKNKGDLEKEIVAVKEAIHELRG